MESEEVVVCGVYEKYAAIFVLYYIGVAGSYNSVFVNLGVLRDLGHTEIKECLTVTQKRHFPLLSLEDGALKARLFFQILTK